MDHSLEHLRSQLAEPLCHPDIASMEQMAGQTLAWVIEHFRTLPQQEIGLTAAPEEMAALLGQPAPEAGTDFSRVLAEFSERVAPYAFRVNHPRFLAFIPGAPSFLSILGDMLTAGTNFFAGVWLEASGPTEVELVVLDWFRNLLGYPATSSGLLTSGGSEANLISLLTARSRLAWEDRTRAVVYTSVHRHASVDRAAMVIGLRPDQVCNVPADPGFRIDLGRLRGCIDQDRAAGKLPWLVVASAGTTNTGTVDPLAELTDLCQAERLWFHVDAAYGWAAVLVPEGRQALDGIERADSITLDPHKWFGQTFEAGCVLIRDGRLLTETFAHRPDYMQDVEPEGDEVNFSDRGLALTRRFRALKIWLSVKVLGLGWFRGLVERCLQLASFAEGLLRQDQRFELLGQRQLSIVCFRHRTPGVDEAKLDRLNLHLAEELRKTGRAFLSTTRIGQKVWLRLCFINWRTTSADVQEVIGLLGKLTEAL